MKCEICHERNASVAIHKTVDGKDCELYVCAGCAKREGAPSDASRPGVEISGESAAPSAASMEALEEKLSGLLFHAIFDAVGGDLAAMSDIHCPKCGLTRVQYRKEGRLGCPACYRAFGAEFASMIQGMHRGTVHVGKIPASVSCKREADRVAAKLRLAVKEQRYEDAARLRDRLRQLRPDAKELRDNGDDAPQGGGAF
ncbi:MAG: UvrB/UvrC motif-containing protein [Kiritimatiellia bacterium]|jgi:protein arginine kinase activator